MNALALQWLGNFDSYNRMYRPQKYFLSGPLQMKFANPFPTLSHIHCHQLIMEVGKRAASIWQDQRGKSILRENESSVEARGCRNCRKGIYHWVEVQREGELGWVCGVGRQRLGRGGTEQWEDQSTEHSSIKREHLKGAWEGQGWKVGWSSQLQVSPWSTSVVVLRLLQVEG